MTSESDNKAIAEFEAKFPGALPVVVKTWIHRHGLDVLTTDPVWALNNLAMDIAAASQPAAHSTPIKEGR